MRQFDNLRPTEEQWLLLNQAMELLKPFDKEERVTSMCYFTNKDSEEFGSDYDCCGERKCVEEAKKSIRHSHGNRKIIEENYTDTLSDYESFDRCCICGSYFNEFLTYIDQEFDHHETNSISVDDFKDSQTAYELRGIFYSLHWSCDNQISGYAKHQYSLGNDEPLNDTLKRQQSLIDRVVKHASLVIEALGKEVTE